MFSIIQRVHVSDASDDLLIKLKQDIRNYMSNDRNQLPGSLHGAEMPTDKSTDESHSWFLTFIDIVCYLPYPENYFSLFVDAMKDYYAENEAEIRLIETFAVEYKSSEALNWYTRPTFLYRIMNKGLRQQKIEQTLLFGFFIQDIYRQLQVEHDRFKTMHANVTKVFRGQVMSLDEIKYLRPCGNIVINSFFSTTADRSVALFFLDAMAQPDSEFQRVLIEIDIPTTTEESEPDKQNQNRIRSRPFADISHLSSIADESEILFMIGTLFIILYHGYNEEENLWTLKLALNYDNQVKFDEHFMLSDGSPRRILKNCISSLPSFPFTYMKEDPFQVICNIFTELKVLYSNERWIEGYELWYMAKYKSQKAVQTQTNLTYLIATCNSTLSLFADYLNDDELNCSIDTGNIHFEIGCEYERALNSSKIDSGRGSSSEQTLGQEMVGQHYNQAVRHYENALEKTTTAYDKIQIFSRLVNIYSSTYYYNGMNDAKRNYMIAAEYKKRSIEEMRKHSFFDNLTIGKQLLDLSFIYDKVGMDDEALNVRIEALGLIPRPCFHMGFLEAELYSTLILDNLIRTYTEVKHDYSAASKYLQVKYENLLRKSNTNDICLAKGHKELAAQYLKIEDFDTTAERLEDALKLYKNSTTYDKDTLIRYTEEKLAEVYALNQKYKEAYEHLFEALRWSEEETISFRKWPKRRIFDTHEKLANYCESFGQNELAYEHLTKALQVYSETSDLSVEDRQRTIINIQQRIMALRSLNKSK